MQAIAHGDSPYGSLICNYFQSEFPQVARPSKSQLVDILTDIIVGDKNLRQGAMPSPEILVNIRSVIREAVDKRLSIPVLIPWGGRKTEGKYNLDIAEVSAIKQVVNVDQAVKAFYEPGLQVNINVEDIGAMWLYRDEDAVYGDVREYTADFYNMVMIVRGSSNINPIAESSLGTVSEYFNLSTEYSQLLYPVLLQLQAGADLFSITEFRKLEQKGWVGDLSKEQRDYYIGRYIHLYGVTEAKAMQMLADYFAGAKARYDLKMKAIPVSDVKGYIKGSFTHPIPSGPNQLFGTTVDWRTIPTNKARTHIAPWRGKGYLKINRNEITPKLMSFTDEKMGQLESASVELLEANFRAVIQTDYLIES